MITSSSREKIEDMRWLQDLLEFYQKWAQVGDKEKMKEITKEIKDVRASIERGDWKERQEKADAHCKGRGCTDVHVCWRYGL